MVFLGLLTLVVGIQTAKPAQGQHLDTVTQTDHFTLRSDSRTALFHFLIDWAAADAEEWPPYALPLTERFVLFKKYMPTTLLTTRE